MPFEVALPGGLVVTNTTMVGSLAGVGPHVKDKVGLTRQGAAAHRTIVAGPLDFTQSGLHFRPHDCLCLQ